MLNQILASLVAVIFLSNPALAQGTNCGVRQAIVDQLTNKYGESRQNVGLNENNSLVEIFASTETGTWTILVTMPTGMSCMVAAGRSWEVVQAEPITPGNPA